LVAIWIGEEGQTGVDEQRLVIEAISSPGDEAMDQSEPIEGGVPGSGPPAGEESCVGAEPRSESDANSDEFRPNEDEISIAMGPVSSSVLVTLALTLGRLPRVLLPSADQASDSEPTATECVTTSSLRGERLQLLGVIGRGGMGVVHRGRDIDLGRDLAVKVLLERFRDQPSMVGRFIAEAQISGQLQHPGVVPVYELGTLSDRRPYIAMKLIKGRTLAELLQSRSSPADGLPQLLGVFESVCQTVAYAHARSVIHRDLKPSNIMVGNFGEVQVMDWGLAKVLPRDGIPTEVTTVEAGGRQTPRALATPRRSSQRLPSIQPAIARDPAACWGLRPTWRPNRHEAKSRPPTSVPMSSPSGRSSARS
jgi:hypothetical protein